MNYADPKLFGEFFAQDEIQVLEHPILACVRRYLLDPGKEDMTPKTVVENGSEVIATPYLIEDVPLWMTVNSYQKLNDGMFVRIYGASFTEAPQEAIDAGCKVYNGDIKNNIMVIAAPSFGQGKYSYDEIVLHSIEDDDIYDDAETKYRELDKEMSLESVVYFLLSQGYRWGRSDGN